MQGKNVIKSTIFKLANLLLKNASSQRKVFLYFLLIIYSAAVWPLYFSLSLGKYIDIKSKLRFPVF